MCISLIAFALVMLELWKLYHRTSEYFAHLCTSSKSELSKDWDDVQLGVGMLKIQNSCLNETWKSWMAQDYSIVNRAEFPEVDESVQTCSPSSSGAAYISL